MNDTPPKSRLNSEKSPDIESIKSPTKPNSNNQTVIFFSTLYFKMSYLMIRLLY